MDPNQNTPLNHRNRKPNNTFALDTTPYQFPTMESPQCGFVNLLQTVRPNTTQERVRWTKEEEEEMLAKAWISASQHPIKCYNQPFDCFWEKVCTGNLQPPAKHTRSGENDFDVFKAALDQFENITPTRKAFTYVKPWLKLKDTPKWKEQTQGSSKSSGSKRSRNPDGTPQQSDGRTHFDINDDPFNLEDDQPLRRPAGRSKAQKKQYQRLRV
uniref:No apical meristem-associated C-terminal domain-containing protein n=1 Tax=Lactuca sativa TaxID=4236 RepID=A0A9R1XU70_LACSA|nr:hypothetical protein LSAT_V11C100019250 [Lactuca sativa]